MTSLSGAVGHAPGMVLTIRCTECRQTVPAAKTARGNQKVCCKKKCRKSRNRKLARKRRRENLVGYRQDEVERKRRSRQGQRDRATAAKQQVTLIDVPATKKGVSTTEPEEKQREPLMQRNLLTCRQETDAWMTDGDGHAQGSVGNYMYLLAKVDTIMDETLEMSRARFHAEVVQFVSETAVEYRLTPPERDFVAVSRARLGSNTATKIG